MAAPSKTSQAEFTPNRSRAINDATAKTTVRVSIRDARPRFPSDSSHQREGCNVHTVKESPRRLRLSNTRHQWTAHRYQQKCREEDPHGGNDRTANSSQNETNKRHIAIHNNVAYDVLPMAYSAVRALLCRSFTAAVQPLCSSDVRITHEGFGEHHSCCVRLTSVNTFR